MESPLAEPLARALDGRDEVLFAYLFGSTASGSTHPRSDVDVAVYLREPRRADPFLEIHALLCDAAGREDVDLVVLNDAPLTLFFEALKGRLLLDRDPGERVSIEAATTLRYHDRLPYLRRHLREAARRIAERGYS